MIADPVLIGMAAVVICAGLAAAVVAGLWWATKDDAPDPGPDWGLPDSDPYLLGVPRYRDSSWPHDTERAP